MARGGLTISDDEREGLTRALTTLLGEGREFGDGREVTVLHGDAVDLFAAVADAARVRGGHRLSLATADQWRELARVAEEAGLDAALVARLREAR